MTQSLGMLIDMGSSRYQVEQGRKTSGLNSIKQSLCDTVISIVVQRLKDDGYSASVCEDVIEHFRMLPARYALTIDPMRHEDLLLHLKLLKDARDAEKLIKYHHGDPYLLPIIYVRKVSLGDGRTGSDFDPEKYEHSISVPTRTLPKPAFGSNLNLAGFGSGSPSAFLRTYSRNSNGSPVGRNTPPGYHKTTPPKSIFSPRKKPGPVFSLCDMEDSDLSPRKEKSSSFGWEITVASTDSKGLLKFFTSALCSDSSDIDIREAHAFSTADGMALEVYVVDGYSDHNPEELRQAVLCSVHSKLSENWGDSPKSDQKKIQHLKTQVEAIAYEDWAVDIKDLHFGSKLGSGSSGRLYRGNYLGQDVAVKVIKLMETTNGNDSGPDKQNNFSGTIRAQPAAELLQLFKQEVSIMRIVRHKNVVQFIGACSKWPKLFIVTELMSGGSVRDMLQNLGTGLDITSAIKVLRDAARGLDFMHRRGIIHRDVKAANLLIDEYNVVKVCDFGVARMLPGLVTHSAKSNALCFKSTEMTAETGTYRWMAPEVLEHKPYNHKADVFSFGIMIWEILTGEIPYNELSPIQAAVGVVQRGIRPIMPKNCPPKLAQLAQSCWQHSANDRPEFAEVLRTLDEMTNPLANLWPRNIFGLK